MTILITGGAGFIGCYLVHRLVEAEQKVVVYDINIDAIKDKDDRAIYIQGDISDIDQLEKVMTEHKFDTVFHLASILPPKTEEDPYQAFKINIEGTMNILNIATKLGVKTVIYPSSATVFGPDRQPPFTEEDLRDPWTVYSSFKICNEIFGSIYSKKFDIDFRAVRFPVVVGPGADPLSGMSSYPIEMMEDALHGVPYVAKVSPETKIPIIYVDDAVQILINLWRSEQAHFEIFDIDGLWVTAKEIADGIKKFIPSAEITFKPVEDATIQKVLTGVREEKEKDRFGFKGKRLLDEILQEYISRKKPEK